MILDELIAYVQLDDTDVARLRALHDRLQPEFASIAARFYEQVWATPAAAAVLSGPEQVERLRVTLIDWMSSGLRGPYDQAFYEKRSRIGRVHVRIGLAQQYMFTAMNVVRTAYLDRIAKLYPADEALLVMRAVDKLFDIELALMLRSYQLDSEEKLVARERAILAERISSLQTLTAGLAHEVRNPLNAAKLQLDVLERRIRKHGDDPRLDEPRELASHEIARLSGLLDEFLAFAHASDLRLATTDVVVIVRAVIELERTVAMRRPVTLELEAADRVVARIDAEKVHQIAKNLLRNAVEASPPHGVVTIALSVDRDALHLRVTDRGSGIPEAIRRRIFEPFFSTKHQGTGMGMAIVHNFVTMHGGLIEITTGATGTTIDVSIPQR